MKTLVDLPKSKYALVLTCGVSILLTTLLASSCRYPTRVDIQNDDENTTPTGLNLSLARNLLLAEVNESRRAMGLSEVELDATANRAAQSHANEMALDSYLSHLDKNGRNPIERYNIAGGWEPAYENAWSRPGVKSLNQSTISQMHMEWMKSEGHKANVLSAAHTHIGIGFAFDRTTDSMYGVELFTSRKAYSVSISKRNIERLGEVEYFAAFDPTTIMFSELLVARADFVGSHNADWLNLNQHYELPEDYIALYVESGASNVSLPGAIKRATLDYDRQAGIVQGNVKIEPGWQSGLYYLYTWGTDVGSRDRALISILTIEVG